MTPTPAKDHSWLGYLERDGLVVEARALEAAQCVPSSDMAEKQLELKELLRSGGDESILADFATFATSLLAWHPRLLVGGPQNPMPQSLSHFLEEYSDNLKPDFALADPARSDAYLLLVNTWPQDQDLCRPISRGWEVSPRARLDRLLRLCETPIGLLCNGRELHLAYAPRGESTGWLVFPVEAMTRVDGREILSGLLLLLHQDRLLNVPPEYRLAAILESSRSYQNDVSTELSKQVLAAMQLLLSGFQKADEKAAGRLIGPASQLSGEAIYGGLLTAIMRLVFLIYAEDARMMPEQDGYHRFYSVTGLYRQLRELFARKAENLADRTGAWSRLLTLFRLVYAGGQHGDLKIPARLGALFDPDAHRFLEGRSGNDCWQHEDKCDPPLVDDHTVYLILRNLLYLKGERLSYQALDVQEIGSVYEAMMGFEIERARGPVLALTTGRNRPDVYLDLDQLLAAKASERVQLLRQETENTSRINLDALRKAETLEELSAALSQRISPSQPDLLPAGSLFLQPGEERRRTGSHYTPRSLTEPIVTNTLAPILEQLGPRPTPQQILDLRICDPAMGSGAFLVEACRQLADVLVDCWKLHGTPRLPDDEDALTHARRLIAQRCLYGVDRNPFAVSLARLSLWLLTLARSHPFTFLDHALRHGDSLLDMSRQQLALLNWTPQANETPLFDSLDQVMNLVSLKRNGIHNLGDGSYAEKKELFQDAENETQIAREASYLLFDAFFSGKKERKTRLRANRLLWDELSHNPKDQAKLQELGHDLRTREKPIIPFLWQVEFPEVFLRENPGFDAFVGNPPFAGKNTFAAANCAGYPDWLQVLHTRAHGNADLAAHFFRLAFDKLRRSGCMGLIATNTIAQGDTRDTGLSWICTHGGTIYHATRRLPWPGMAAVVVSVVHIKHGNSSPAMLDGKPYQAISAYLVPGNFHEKLPALSENNGRSFVGSYVLGMGFTFDDTDTKGTANSLADMQQILAKDPKNGTRIFPYIGGREINTSPTHAPHRFVINFEEMTEDQARQWPDLMDIVEEKVKPERQKLKDNASGQQPKNNWWLWCRYRPALFKALEKNQGSCLACARVSDNLSFVFMPPNIVFSEQLICFPICHYSGFTILQSRFHEIWTRFFGSSLEERLRYTPDRCFSPFPFPKDWETSDELEQIGAEYYNYRARLMVANDEGLTKTYNRFHDPEETDEAIIKLRQLHHAMDRAVLNAYGWLDLNPVADFYLDYEIDEETWPENKKKPLRYRWSNEIQDQILDRLMLLNGDRHQEDLRKGLQGGGKTATTRKNTRPKVVRPPQPGLFDGDFS